ncbi:lipoprotein signal peptidase [Desulfuromonas sp. DDH964]|uniref:signal peptidase II n=1 Tax=Desulfuromonas sp. DDH964 TaxID=1823759 RepID=UPI00078B765B|nr:signal peptidase II [Desulfuromonas sp. DDH964]AMV71141.1 lipoprotein signal peptidase [Desulfuromonas sp. DDH964]
MSRYRLLAIVTAVVLVLDQATKLYVDSHFRLHESVTVLENFFHFTYVRNKGAAFGIFADSAIRIPFFITVSLVAAVGILWYLRRLKDNQKLVCFSLALIFSGALGNLIDRVRFGEVIDFIDVHWYQYHWPAFNVADSAISVGVTLLLVDLWREERARKAKC